MNQTQEKLAREAANTYDPVECLREEVIRFKATNQFSPLLVTNFYCQAAVVLDDLDRIKRERDKLRSDLESARKQIAEMRDAVRAIPELNLGNYTDDDIRALQDSVLEADRICQSSTGSNYVSFEHPVIVEMAECLKKSQEWGAKFPLRGTLSSVSDEDLDASTAVYEGATKALAAFQQLKGESK